MNWKNYIRGLSVCTLIFGGILIFLTIAVAPDKSLVNVIIYLACLFFFLFGLSGIAGFSLRRVRLHNEIVYENIRVSLRQGFLIASMACVLLLLRGLRVLNLLDAAIIVASFFLLEMYFKTRD